MRVVADLLPLVLIYKMEWFIDVSATNKNDNLTCVDYRETHNIINRIGIFLFSIIKTYSYTIANATI